MGFEGEDAATRGVPIGCSEAAGAGGSETWASGGAWRNRESVDASKKIMPDPNFDLSRVRSGPILLSEERELEKTEHRSIDHECVLCKDDPASPAEYPSGLRGRIANPLFVGSNPTSAFTRPFTT